MFLKFFPLSFEVVIYHTSDLQRHQPPICACLARLLQEQAQPYLLMIYLRKTFPSPTLLGIDRAAN